jgi:hypothetical protein
MARSQLGIMAGFQKVKYSVFCILTTLHLFVASDIAFTQDPPTSAAGNVMPPATGVNPERWHDQSTTGNNLL